MPVDINELVAAARSRIREVEPGDCLAGEALVVDVREPAEFAQASADYRQKVDALVAAAQGSDLDRIKAAVSQVEGSCRSCHDAFRKP